MTFEGSSSEVCHSAADYDCNVLFEFSKGADQQWNQSDCNTDAESYDRSEHSLLGKKSCHGTTIQETRPVPWHGSRQPEWKIR